MSTIHRILSLSSNRTNEVLKIFDNVLKKPEYINELSCHDMMTRATVDIDHSSINHIVIQEKRSDIGHLLLVADDYYFKNCKYLARNTTVLPKRPMLRVPQAPHTPCTLMAPTGSSILSFCSMKSAAKTTRTPPTAPMMAADTVETLAQGAVMETRPARQPLMVMVRSGLPNFSHVVMVAAAAPQEEAMRVVTAT